MFRSACNAVCSLKLPLSLPLSLQLCEIADSQLCAGGEEGRGACQGDSGSALVVRHKERRGAWTFAGVTSWSRGWVIFV